MTDARPHGVVKFLCFPIVLFISLLGAASWIAACALAAIVGAPIIVKVTMEKVYLMKEDTT